MLEKNVSEIINYENPLVTLAVFSYNQENYIRDAVEGALAQDYSPLEIIISDDCSTDQSYQIIQRVIGAYKGPHNVTCRQTKKNLGTLLHVADVADKASGKLFVLAAGDDVSKINRVTVIQGAWKRSGAWGFSSKFDRIDENGFTLEREVDPKVIEDHNFGNFFYSNDGPIRVVHGATSAYDSKIFHYLKLIADDYVLSEDGALSVLLNLLGKDIFHISESLILYRESNNSLTNSPEVFSRSYIQIINDEIKIERFAKSQANRCRLFIRMDSWLENSKVRSININGVASELLKQETVCNWYFMSMCNRILALINNKVSRAWALPRLFGKKLFYISKWLKGYIKIILLLRKCTWESLKKSLNSSHTRRG